MATITPKIWINVPDGSTLRVRAEGTTDTFNIDMRIDCSDDAEDAVLNHVAIVSGAEVPVHSPRQYAITVRTIFSGGTQTTARFRAELVRPNGNLHDQPYEFEVSDPGGSPYSALIGIVTV